MAKVKWIKLMTDIFDNRKIRQIENLPEGDTIVVIWVKLLCLAGETNDRGMVYFTKEIPYTEEMLASQFDRPLTTIRMALNVFQKFEMIELIDNILCISNWEKYQNVEGMERIREQNRLRKQKQRERQKALPQCAESHVTGHVTVTDCHATEEERRKKKEEKEEEYILCASDDARGEKKPTKQEVNSFFEEIWKLYPVKKGKGQVSDAKRKKLYDIGLANMQRAIYRYLTELEKDDWRKPQNGSTFFNSGYVDYLDENFEPDQPQKKQKNKAAEQLDESYRMMAAWAEDE